jgi:hypothetical protein
MKQRRIISRDTCRDLLVEVLFAYALHAIIWFVSMEDAMSQTSSLIDQVTPQNLHSWVQHVPDGAVSIAVEDSTLVLKASNALQERFETLLAKQKDGTLSAEEVPEYQAICDLDTALS